MFTGKGTASQIWSQRSVCCSFQTELRSNGKQIESSPSQMFLPEEKTVISCVIGCKLNQSQTVLRFEKTPKVCNAKWFIWTQYEHTNPKPVPVPTLEIKFCKLEQFFPLLFILSKHSMHNDERNTHPIGCRYGIMHLLTHRLCLRGKAHSLRRNNAISGFASERETTLRSTQR